MRVRKRTLIISSFVLLAALIYIGNLYKKASADNIVKAENQTIGIKHNIETTFNFTDNNIDESNKLDKDTFTDLKKDNANYSSKIYIPEQVEKRIKSVKDDIKNSFNLIGNIEQYIELDLSTIPEFIKKGYKDYFNVTTCTEFIVKIDNYRHSLPRGSVKPLILINKNGKELIFAYKEANGKNVMKKALKHNNSWIESEDIKQGSPILEIHSNPVS